MRDALTHLPDDVLLGRCRDEPEAFCVVYDRHVRGLLAWITSSCGDADVALDVVQETFARALRDAHRFHRRGDGSALPWLRTIARNLVRDWRRRGVVEDRVRRELGIAEVAAVDPWATAVERVHAGQAQAQVKAALSLLPTAQRDAVAARVLLGASYDEIATAGGVTREAARARVSRGLRTLRALLAPSRGAS